MSNRKAEDEQLFNSEHEMGYRKLVERPALIAKR